MRLTRTLGRLAIALSAAGLMALAQAETTIAYITNGNTNEGWTLINGGAKKAGSAAGVKFIELAAEKGELSKQLAIVEDFVINVSRRLLLVCATERGCECVDCFLFSAFNFIIRNHLPL